MAIVLYWYHAIAAIGTKPLCDSRLFQEDSEAVIWMGERSSSVRCNPCILLPDIRAHYEKEGREGILTAEVCVLNNLFCANDI